MGIDPESREIPFTLGELIEEYRDRLNRDWQPTAWILAMLHNINSKERKTPDDFNPYVKRGSAIPFKTQVAALRKQFLGE